MSSLLARAAQPRTRVVVIGLWLVAIFACFGFNLPGKFSDAERNDSSSYLPGDAESTRALEATKQLTARRAGRGGRSSTGARAG